jgi:acyl dehydratase
VTLHFEDFPAGWERELGTWTPLPDAVAEFGRQWDPRPEHVDGTVASGWHLVCEWGRLYVEQVHAHAASMGGGGFDDVRFPAPARAGEPLLARVRVLEAIPSRTRPDRGTSLWQGTFEDAGGRVVLSLRGLAFFRRRS